MVQIITITPSWQIHIPVNVRVKLGLTMPGRAQIKVEKEKIVVIPKKSRLLALAGKYKHLAKRTKVDLDNIRDHIDYSNL